MKHRISGKKLGRNRNQRQALFKSQAMGFFTTGTLSTTDAKIKAIIPLIEKICALAKKNTLASRRRIFDILQNVKMVNNIVTQVNKLYPDTNSNFTRTVRVKRRQGDDALIVKLSLFNGLIEKVEAPAKEDKKAKVKAKPVKKAASKEKTVAKKPVQKKVTTKK